MLISEDGDYWEHLQLLANDAKLKGPAIHDARVAALCQLHGVRELWTADRDFSRLKIVVRNPLI